MTLRVVQAIAGMDGRVVALGAGLLALAVYLRTLAPTVMWYDMGEFATASHVLGIAHNTGYPFYLLLGKAFTYLPVGDVAYRVNLLSAVCSAGTVVLVALTIYELTRSRFAALVGALTLAFSSTFWANANWAVSYPLNALSTALITWLLLRWRATGQAVHLYIAALTLGLSLGNHRLIVLLAPGMAVYLWQGRAGLGPTVLVRLALFFLIGLSVYAYLPIRGEQGPALSWAQPATLDTYWSMFLTGGSRSEYWDFAFLGRLDVVLRFPLYDFTALGLALTAAGGLWLARKDALFTTYAVVLCALTSFVVLSYSIHNVYNYFIPAYLMLAIAAGCGAHALSSWVRQREARPALRVALGAVILVALPAVLLSRNLPAVDRSEDYAAYDFARTTLERLPPNATVVTDSWSASPMWYLQLVDGLRRDVFVSPVFSVPGEDVRVFVLAQMEEGRPVYVAEGLRGDVSSLGEGLYAQPVLLNGIETMLTDVLPKPQYKDALVPRGTLYRVLDEPPELTVAGGSPDPAVLTTFDDVRLVRFHAEPHIVERGEVVRLTFDWQLTAMTSDRLHATAFFVAEDRSVAMRDGFPLWWQTRELGGGLYPTNVWARSEVVREEYFVLVPRTVEPGTYYPRLRVHAGELEQLMGSDPQSESRVLASPIIVR